MPEKPQNPDLFEYSDYRQYLKDCVRAQKAISPRFSLTALSRKMGLKSSGHLSLILSGKRGLTSANLRKLAQALKMDPKQQVYFETLVRFNQSKSLEESDHYLERLNKLSPKRKFTNLEEGQFAFFTKRHFVAIHQLIDTPDFQEDAAWIRSRLRYPLSFEDVKSALRTLIDLGLVKRDANGKLKHSTKNLKTDNLVRSFDAFRYHYGVLSDAAKALAVIPHGDRDYRTMTFTFPMEKMGELRERIQEFFEETLQWLESATSDQVEVCHMGLQFFPVTRRNKA